jgi:hypothetical protein
VPPSLLRRYTMGDSENDGPNSTQCITVDIVFSLQHGLTVPHGVLPTAEAVTQRSVVQIHLRNQRFSSLSITPANPGNHPNLYAAWRFEKVASKDSPSHLRMGMA